MKKFIFLFLMILASSLLISRAITTALKTSVPKFVWERETTGLSETSRALKEAMTPLQGKATFIIGSSVTMKAQDLRQPTRNLGFYASTPDLLNILTDKIEAEKFDIAVIEFLPQNLTRKARKSLDKTTKLRTAFLLEPNEILKNLPAHPLFWSEVLSMELLGLSSPEINSNLLLYLVRKSTQTQEHNRPLDRNEDLRLDVLRQIEKYDLVDLDIDPAVLQIYISLIQKIKIKSRCLVIVAPPDNSALWKRSASGSRNLDSAISEIKRLSGQDVVPLDMYQNFQPEHFKDATHVMPGEGQKLMNQALTEAIQKSC